MQLGTRWNVGGEPPSRLPEELVARIREVEAGLDEADAATMRWTLTWLEGRPVAELDDGTILRG
jgi:hypothetical protein